VIRERELDYAPLAGKPGPGTTLRAVGRNPLMVVAGTIGTLMVLVCGAVIAGMVATGNIDGGGMAVCLMFLVGGLYCWVDIWAKAGGDSSLAAFAARNDLDLVGTSAADYAGSDFRYGTHAVHQSVRTREERFVEVGDRFPVENVRHSHEERRPELFLRARLSGPVPAGTSGARLVDDDLDGVLARLAGSYRVEVTGDELTVLGERPLAPSQPERVREAFEVVDELAARAEERVVSRSTPSATPSGIPVPAAAPRRRGRGRPFGPVRTVLATLGLLVGAALGIAIVMSILDDSLRGDRSAAQVVVSLLIVVMFAVVGGFIRWLLRSRD
jgi:hypothetical protein